MHELMTDTSEDHAEVQLYSNLWDSLPYFWTTYVAWVMDNYVHNLKNPTMGQLVDANLSECGLIRVYAHRHCKIMGAREDLIAWMLAYL
jgi:hypothetical protein